MSPRRRHTWVLLNQSQSPSFQSLVERLTPSLGPCQIVTGMPHPRSGEQVTLRVGPSYDRRGLGRRAWSWFRFLVFCVRTTLLMRGRPFVLAVTNPPMLPHWAWLLSKLRGFPYGLLVWDIYPEHIVRQGWLGERHPLVRIWSWLNRRALCGAEVVITIGDGMAQSLVHQSGGGLSTSVAVIPNWADVQLVRPLHKEENPFARAHGLVDKTTVLYSGNMGASHGLLSLVDAANVLRDETSILFVFIGDGLGREQAEEAARSQGLENVLFMDRRPWSELPYSLASADIAVVIQAPGTEDLSVPSKTYTAMAAGSAILGLTSVESDLSRLIETHEAGSVCDRDDAHSIASAILALTSSGTELQRLQSNARSAAENGFSEDVAVDRFRAALAPYVVSDEA